MSAYDTYFDYASTTPVSDAVLTAMKPFFQQDFYNPSALYEGARKVKAAIEDARAVIADDLQVRAAEVFFMAGATEANNTAISGVMNLYPGKKMLYSQIEHDSVKEVAKTFDAQSIPVNKDGMMQLQSLSQMIDDDTVLVCCMSANNEIGTIQPLKEIGQMIDIERKKRLANGNQLPLFFHIDASQSFQYLKLLPRKLSADFVVAGGSKLYGPKQSAFLYVRQGIGLQPLLLGGGQEYGLRPGTESAAQCVGLATAVKETSSLRRSELERLKPLQQWFIDELEARYGAVINGSVIHRLPNNVHATFKDVDNEYVAMALDEIGIQVSVGSACHASSEEPSSVLLAIGLSEEAIRSSIRFSFGRYTTKASLSRLLDGLSAVLQR